MIETLFVLFIAANGGKVSNEHYPYYELLLKFSDNKSTPELIANHRLFDEIAGFEEFFLWYFLWIFLIVIGFILSISLTFLLIPFKVYIKPQAISLSGEDYLLNNRRDAAESVILGVSPMNNFSRERTQSKERRRDLS